MLERYFDAPSSPGRTPDLADGSSEWDPCPCRQCGVVRADRHGCAAMKRDLNTKETA
jgi:hypothetical protein